MPAPTQADKGRVDAGDNIAFDIEDDLRDDPAARTWLSQSKWGGGGQGRLHMWSHLAEREAQTLSVANYILAQPPQDTFRYVR